MMLSLIELAIHVGLKENSRKVYSICIFVSKTLALIFGAIDPFPLWAYKQNTKSYKTGVYKQ